MGILNLSSDSFSSIGRAHTLSDALLYAEKMVQAGVDIIDVGAEPTNPKVHPITSTQQEIDLILPVLEALREAFDVPLSVDTSKPEVMRLAIREGVSLINDVRALRHPGAIEVIADSAVTVCLMHMAYPNGDAPNPLPENKNDIVAIVKCFLEERLSVCAQYGIGRERIILDPGIGSGSFGKTCQQNLVLLSRLNELKLLGLPLLVGVSRKTFIGEITNRPVNERLYGTIAANVMAILHGADIIRVHDVAENLDALKVVRAILDTIRAAEIEALRQE